MDLIKQIINLDEDKLLVTGKLEEVSHRTQKKRTAIQKTVAKEKKAAKKAEHNAKMAKAASSTVPVDKKGEKAETDETSQVTLGDNGIPVDAESKGTAEIKSNVWVDLEKIMNETPEPDANFFITNQETFLGLFERSFELEKESKADTSHDIRKKDNGGEE